MPLPSTVRSSLLAAGIAMVSTMAWAQQTGVAQQQERATAAFRAGTAAFNAGDLAAAQSSFAQAVQLAPRVSAAHAALAAVLLAQGQPAEAEREFLRAHQLDPHSRPTQLNLAIAASLAADYPASAEQFHALLSSEPGADDVLGTDAVLPLARALTATGDLPGANDLLLRAVAASPEDAALADALGTVQAARGAFPEAEATLRHALQLQPSLAPAHFHLGAVLLEQQHPDLAVAELQAAHALAPADPGYTLQLARALAQRGDDAAAADLLTPLLAAPPPGTDLAELRYRLALALQGQGKTKEALPLFDAAVADRPQEVDTLTNAGLAHVQAGDAPGGIALYARAAQVRTPSAVLHEDLGVAYLQQGDLNRALEQFRQGLALDGSNPQLHYDLGLALKLKDDLAGAVPEFERAAELDPTLPDPPYTLGVIFMQQGRFPDAAARLERATELRPDNGDAWATLGSVYRQSDQFPQAIAALHRAIALLPNQPSPHMTLASILAQQGHKDEAAAERKIGAELTRQAVSRQKAQFGIDSGNLLLAKGKLAEALLQFQDAVAADPGFGAAHLALASGLDRAGKPAEAAEQRRLARAAGPAK